MKGCYDKAASTNWETARGSFTKEEAVELNPKNEIAGKQGSKYSRWYKLDV